MCIYLICIEIFAFVVCKDKSKAMTSNKRIAVTYFKYWDNKYVVLSKRLPRLESGAFLKSSIVDALDTVLYRLVLGSLLGILFFIYSEQMNWHLVFKYWCCMFWESRIINYGDDTKKIQITKWSIFHKLSDAGSVKLCDMLVYYFLISQ